MQVKAFQIAGSQFAEDVELTCDALNTWLRENTIFPSDIANGTFALTTTRVSERRVVVTILYDEKELERRRKIRDEEITAHRFGVKC
ncbi:MAG: hypothetical protein KBC02_01475 [Candidatus Pacebacteria bacterium]|nr:hypothetical protein [Candidatus Paceibacterota bacterium]